MKPATLIFILVLAAAAAGPLAGAEPPPLPAPPPKVGAAPPLPPRFKQVRDRIDALYQHRTEPPPIPDARSNPFRLPGASGEAKAPLVPGEAPLPGGVAPEAPSSDLSRLQQTVAALKVSGTFEKDARLYLVINGKPYKDNDVIPTQFQGEPVYLRVRQISRRGVTVVLNEAEITLKF